MRSIITGTILTIGVVLAGAAGAYAVNAPGVTVMPDTLITEVQWPPKPPKCENVTSCGNWIRYYPKVKVTSGPPVCKMRRHCCKKYYTAPPGGSCKVYAQDCREETQDCPRKIRPGR